MPKFEVSKSIEIDGPVEKVFDIVVDFEQGRTWSPWSNTETDHDSHIIGNAKEVWGIFGWSGRRTGEWEMEHKEIIENEYILDELRFFKPWKSTDQASWLFESISDKQTKVTWNMHGWIPFFMFFMTKMMTGMIGENYERGLRMLKEYIETGEVLTSITEPEVKKLDWFSYIWVEASCHFDDMGTSMESAFSKVKKASSDCEVTGYPFSLYKKFDMANKHCEYIAALPVSDGHEAPDGFVSGKVESSDVMQVTHTGKYEHIGNAWNAVIGEIRAQKMKMKKGMLWLEQYSNDPTETEPKDLQSIISVPLR